MQIGLESLAFLKPGITLLPCLKLAPHSSPSERRLQPSSGQLILTLSSKKAEAGPWSRWCLLMLGEERGGRLDQKGPDRTAALEMGVGGLA